MKRLKELVNKKCNLTKWITQKCMSNYEYITFSILLNEIIREEFSKNSLEAPETIKDIINSIWVIDRLMGDGVGESAYIRFMKILDKLLCGEIEQWIKN